MNGAINFKSELAQGLERQAEWRRDQMERHPEDAQRNLDAAKLFDGLAAQVDAGDIDPAIMRRFVEFVFEAEDGITASEITGEFNREIGFGCEPANIDAYLSELISRLEAAA